MARKFLVPLDLNKNEIQNAVVQNLASAPSSPVEGQIYYDTSAGEKTLYFYDGTGWVNSASVNFGSPGNSAVGDTSSDGVAETAARSDHRHGREGFGSPAASAVGDAGADGNATTVARSNHVHAREGFGSVTTETSFGQASGNGSASTISRSDHTHGTPAHDTSAHSGISISDLSAAAADVSMGGNQLTNVGAPGSGTDAANKDYVDNVAAGLDWKGSVRAASTGNLTLSGTQTVDGVSLSATDRILVKNQTAPEENGIYTVAAGAWSRASDADSWSELVSAAVWVEEGSSQADTGWVITADAGGTLGTTEVTIVQFTGAAQITAGGGLTKTGNTLNVGAGTGITVNTDDVAIDTSVVSRKYATTIGDGAATSFNVDHNLGTLDALVQVFQNSDGMQVEPDLQRSTTNRVIVSFATAPASNSYRVVVAA